MIAWLLALAFACDHPPEVRYDGATFTATFCTGGAPWAGATLRRASDSFHHDLEAVPTEGAEEVTMSARVGRGFVQYVVATWTEKQACTEGRHGCEAYGYELTSEYGEPAYAWPENAYKHGIVEHGFADISRPKVQLLDAGLGAKGVEAATAALAGQSMPAVDGGPSQTPRQQIEVLYRNRWDRPRAWALAARLKQAEVGVRWSVTHWAEAPEAFVVALGAP